MSRFSSWIPELARRKPGKNLILSYQVPAGVPPVDVEKRVEEALRSSGLATTRDSASSWRTTLSWQTRVFGLIPRDVDEDVALHLEQHPDLWELRVDCHPLETHGAHAAGFAGVLFVAASVWIASGIATGVVAALAKRSRSKSPDSGPSTLSKDGYGCSRKTSAAPCGRGDRRRSSRSTDHHSNRRKWPRP